MEWQVMTEWVLRRRIAPFLGSANEQSAAGNGGSSQPPPASPDIRTIPAILEDQRALVTEFDRLTAGKSREVLLQPDNDGGWGVVDILSHLLDWERVTHDRVHRILSEDRPYLPDFDDSLWAVEHNYRANDPDDVLTELREHREALVEELEGLEEADWQRVAELQDHGEITLQWLMNNVCDHDRKHLKQARDVLA
jgi:hypothetical protein